MRRRRQQDGPFEVRPLFLFLHFSKLSNTSNMTGTTAAAAAVAQRRTNQVRAGESTRRLFFSFCSLFFFFFCYILQLKLAPANPHPLSSTSTSRPLPSDPLSHARTTTRTSRLYGHVTTPHGYAATSPHRRADRRRSARTCARSSATRPHHHIDEQIGGDLLVLARRVRLHDHVTTPASRSAAICS
jgi:hypothetical protein